MAIFTIGLNPAIDRILECPGFHIGGHQHAYEVAHVAGGKAVNVSRALALLGVDSIATGFLGNQDVEFFHNQLMGSGPGRIMCRFVEVGGKTRENVTIIDPERRVETHLRDRGFAVTPAEAELLRTKLSHDLRPADMVILSGSLCEGLASDYLGGLIDLCNHAGARVALDSSGDALRQVLVTGRRVWLLKPNMEELRAIIGREVPNAATAVRDAARELLPHASLILASRGAAGAVLVQAAPGGQEAPAALSGRAIVQTAAVRSVGCGDFLLAGFVADILAGHTPDAALRGALALATARAFCRDPDGLNISKIRVGAGDVELMTL
jgi:1-phosphofructokinase